MAKLIKPDSVDQTFSPLKTRVFLAGTIDNGNSVDWQSKTAQLFNDRDIVIFNPRVDWWDTNADKSAVVKQINWELNALDSSNIILFYFAPGSVSPITLLELGLHLGKSQAKLIVYCPDDFWRATNVETTIEYETFEDELNFEPRVTLCKTEKEFFEVADRVIALYEKAMN